MINIRSYNKRRKRLTAAIKSLHPLQPRTTGVQKRAISYFLEVSTVDETRRSRSDNRGERAEAPADNAPAKDSVKY